MPLSQSDRIQISGDMVDLPGKIQQANDAVTNIDVQKVQLQGQDNGLKVFYNKYDLITVAYQDELKQLTGTSCTKLLEQDLIDSAQRLTPNKFFPTDGTWTSIKPKNDPVAQGAPTSVYSAAEALSIGANLQTHGLEGILNFMTAGQSSAVPDDTVVTYSATSISVTTGGQTNNKYLYIKDGNITALVYITGVSGTTLTITEIIAPNGTITPGATVVENILAFTNTERNTLVSGNYQNILTGLSNLAITAGTNWASALAAQLTALNANTDSRSPQITEISTAKTDVNNTTIAANAWNSLPNTGSSGSDSKFTNNNITTILGNITTRNGLITTRTTQINTALGSITQTPDGNYSGSGMYYLRFQQVDNRINLGGGPLSEYYQLDKTKKVLQDQVANLQQRQTTYNSELRTEALTTSASGNNNVTVSSNTGFSVGNSIYVMSDTLTELTGTITAISGTIIALSFNVPNTYTKELRARLYKQL